METANRISENKQIMAPFRNASLIGFGVTLMLIASGCKESTSVIGSVTYNGEPVEKGYIMFHPTDGHGQTFATEIAGGHYHVKDAVPGPRSVVVTGVKEIDFYSSSEESYRKAEEARAAGEDWTDHVAERADYILEDAEGNGQTVEITGGSQTLDLAITGPPRD